ncbi:hypothetical protein HPB51_023225 [Rhipicephalus microplus]|uniref:Cullin family profile domain-containing protein n=1 Tax=Rhipicephalus microplus TaxID=6941 RepID=A0A9J6EC88_RHIMP|nr:hypothetical protein HPB51_023225 [Rhipicephalus microplus]
MRYDAGSMRMTEQDIDSVVKEVAAIFSFLPDKDLFVSCYTEHLAKRLLACRNTSQLKSQEVPGNAFETFRRFYLAKYKGRQLTLQPQLGSAVMSAVFYGPWEEQPSSSRATNASASKLRTYTIQVTTFQMCVLTLFNSHDKLTYADIASETNIPEKDLAKALHSLCSGKTSGPLLTKTPGTEQIEDNHVFAVNDAFTTAVQKDRGSVGVWSKRISANQQRLRDGVH